MASTIVVIGGANGGPVAAARAREFAEDARIVLLEKRNHVSWVQAGLRYHLAGEVGRISELDTDRQEFFKKRHRIEVRTGCEVVGIDADSRRVIVKTGEEIERIRYDSVIFSGGAESVVPEIDGLAGEGCMSFRNLDDLQAIRSAIKGGAKSAAVIGCGAFGLEAIEGLRAAGLTVHVIEQKKRVLPGFSRYAAAAAARALREGNVQLHLGTNVERATPNGEQGRTLQLDDGTKIDVDLVVVSTGMRPRTQLLADAGASLNFDGSVRTDPYMQTTLPNVYACGTAVSVPHAVTRAHLWVPQSAIIDHTAQIAGRNSAVDAKRGPKAAKERLQPVAGTTMHEVGGVWFARTGLSEAAAREAFTDGESEIALERIHVSTVHSWTGEAWLGGKEICVRIVVDRERDVVVGGEAWGRDGVARRIDILAAAVLGEWSPRRIADLDVAYAPALGPAFDAINAVGTLASMALNGEAHPISIERFSALIANDVPLQLLDVGRSDRGDRAAWPEGTKHLPLEDIRDRISEVDKSAKTILLSHTGRRAQLASRVLAHHGVEDVSFLDGGLLTWSLAQEDTGE